MYVVLLAVMSSHLLLQKTRKASDAMTKPWYEPMIAWLRIMGKQKGEELTMVVCESS